MKLQSQRERNMGIKGKMPMNIYLKILTLTKNGLNAPNKQTNKKHRVADCVRKHILHICSYNRHTSEQKTYTDWKWRDGEKYSKQV